MSIAIPTMSARIATALVVVGAGVCLGAGPALASQPTSDGVPVSVFATDYQGCAGPLRSAIANGSLAGAEVGDLTVPDGFDGSFNPGAHLGSTDEIAFLEAATGLDKESVAALCASLSTSGPSSR
jgi:hypothetical protein